ncbi:hypothetical protein THASP1DRAFT_27070 [Thamnocephalis sphaerospora]|uniref:DUF7607 domain-containing protein n=1 Tax=Thamnocephalis sphaerospora TaxID=78915 RepID=A0A4P9XYG8_9FUNG|nr:hypothetical protein THASP1DRAFT_27070 [Thamnocephalis sphaerospora]|eukprot:RKP11152.1 hypothetical protein THASP1DRAFT_27070 [Thamnocephalis sphaerospora]
MVSQHMQPAESCKGKQPATLQYDYASRVSSDDGDSDNSDESGYAGYLNKTSKADLLSWLWGEDHCTLDIDEVVCSVDEYMVEEKARWTRFGQEDLEQERDIIYKQERCRQELVRVELMELESKRLPAALHTIYSQEHRRESQLRRMCAVYLQELLERIFTLSWKLELFALPRPPSPLPSLLSMAFPDFYDAM